MQPFDCLLYRRFGGQRRVRCSSTESGALCSYFFADGFLLSASTAARTASMTKSLSVCSFIAAAIFARFANSFGTWRTFQTVSSMSSI